MILINVLFKNLNLNYYLFNYLFNINQCINYFLYLIHSINFGDWGLGPIPNPQSPKKIKLKCLKNIYLKINHYSIIIKQN